MLFWLAKQTEQGWSDEDREFPRAFAQTSRYELADLAARSRFEAMTFVLGIEEGFTGANYIRWRQQHDFPEVVIQETLHDTVDEALRIVSEV